jgi:hypothetical protein
MFYEPHFTTSTETAKDKFVSVLAIAAYGEWRYRSILP